MNHIQIYQEAAKLGITSLRPFQELIIFSIMESIEKKANTPLLATLPTGGGKSLCFTLPALMIDGITIIVYPIKALMHDQHSYFLSKNINAVCLEGGMSKEAIEEAFKKLRTKQAKILITNIEMLSSYNILLRLRALPVMLFVVDEAHTVITWGETFRQAYLKIGQVAKFLGSRVILAFTATTNDYINKRLKEVLFLNQDYHFIQGGSNRSNLIFHVKVVISKRAEIIKILKEKERLPALIFVSRRKDAEILQPFFSGLFNTKYYHAGLDSAKKLEIEDWFYKSKDGLLIATCAYGMGVNKKNIRTVIHYSLPDNATDYLQESGRGGRDGRPSHAFALIDERERSELKALFLKKKCIRASLIQALGQSYGDSCTGCSFCLDENIYDYAYAERVIAFVRRRIVPITYGKLLSRISTPLHPILPYYTREEAKALVDKLIYDKKIKKILNFLV